MITTHHWKIWPCRAVTGANLVEALDWVVGDVATRLYYSSVAPPVYPAKEAQGQEQAVDSPVYVTGGDSKMSR